MLRVSIRKWTDFIKGKIVNIIDVDFMVLVNFAQYV